jgi:hypothetical protein
LAVDQDDGDARPVSREAPAQPKHQAAVARTQFDYAPRRINRVAEHAPGHDGRVQHNLVQAPKVAARPHGCRIIGRQNIEQLGFKAAGEGHRNPPPFPQAARPVRNSIVSAMRPGPNAMRSQLRFAVRLRSRIRP